MVQLLLLKGADTEAMDRKDRTPLFLAVDYDNVAAAIALIAAGANVSRRFTDENVSIVHNWRLTEDTLTSRGRRSSTGQTWTLLTQARRHPSIVPPAAIGWRLSICSWRLGPRSKHGIRMAAHLFMKL